MAAIGIDLGTTNSVAAFDDGHEGHILPTGTGEFFTPSVVSFGKQGLLVGRHAWNNAVVAPENTIFSIKRLMGRSSYEKEIDEVRKTYPYKVVAADDPGGRDVRVVLNGVKYTPEDISTMILRQVVQDAEQALNDQVTHAVITVPAYFIEPQRAATRDAGMRAGLTIKKIIDEPTAAAIAFGKEQVDQDHTLLVFDMGGGTLDVSIGYMDNLQFVGIAITGDMWLGGDDFDREIIEMIIEWAKETFDVSLRDDKRFLALARREAERVKCLLSEQLEADLSIPGIVPLPGGQAASVRMTITRNAFENRIRKHVEKSEKLVRDAMAKKSRGPEDISAVLLVGGATYVPLVRQMLVSIFGAEKIRHDVNPMQAVALGAAILARQLEGIACPVCGRTNAYDATTCVQCGASLSTAWAAGGAVPFEVTALGLGIGVVDKQKGPDIFSVLIEGGTPYPLEQPKRRRYFTTGYQITIPVYEGNNPVASLNEYLGLVEYQLPADTPPRTPVFVQFNYDRDRILKVRIDVEGRRELSYETTPRRHSPDPARSSDDAWRTVLQNSVAFVEMMIERYGEFIDQQQQADLKAMIDRARLMLADQDQNAGQQALSELTQAIGNLEIAYRLFLADRMMQEVDPRTAQWLAEQSRSLREAYQAKDATRVTRIRKGLEAELMHIADTLPMGQDIQGYGGLLERAGDADAPAAS